MNLKLDREYRIAELRAREAGAGGMELFGVPLRFEVPTVIRGVDSAGETKEYIEIVDSRALDGADMSDTVFRHNHTDVLARVRNKSLTLIRLADRLEMRASLSDTQKSRDIYTEVMDGLLPEMSFAFPPASLGTRSEWTRTEDGTPMRRITHIPKLIDVSTAYNGAYADTQIFARSFEEMDIELRALDSVSGRLDSHAEIELLKQKIILKGKI